MRKLPSQNCSIELKLRTPHQLFDERDPSPFRERDLDDDAASYIHGSFRDLRDHRVAKRPIHLAIYFETLGDFQDRPEVIVDAIHSFFRFQADNKRRELRDIFRQGVFALIIGVSFLFVCTSLAQALKTADTTTYANGRWMPMLFEGLSIMGWVAMWRPISIFLYEWWPIHEARLTHHRLSSIDIEIHSQHTSLKPASENEFRQPRTSESRRALPFAKWKLQ